MIRYSASYGKYLLCLIVVLLLICASCLSAGAETEPVSEDRENAITGSASFRTPSIGTATDAVPVIQVDSTGVQVIDVHWERMLDTGYSAPYTDSVIHKGNYILCATFVVDADADVLSTFVRIDGQDWTILSSTTVDGARQIVAASPTVSATGYEPEKELPADSMSTIIIIVFSIMGAGVIIAVVVTILVIKKKNNNPSENGEQK